MKKSFLRFSIILAASQIPLACGKKSETSDDLGSTEATVTENTGNTLSVAGTLNIVSGLRLTAAAKGVLLFTLDSKSKLVGAPTEIEVGSDGSFAVEIDRSRLEKVKGIITDGVVDRTKAKELFPQYAAEIDAMSNEELVEGLGEEIAYMEENPNMNYVLVSYDKSGDREAEAASMQFIGLPTTAASLKMLPGEALKGDLSLGLISGSGDEATSALTASDSLDLSDSVLEELAGASQTLKFLKNAWMNADNKVEVTPWFGYANTDLDGTVNKFTTPANLTFTGGSYYIRPSDIGATWGEICPANPANANDTTGTAYTATPAKIVTWFPPVELTSAYSSEVFGPTTPYTNAGGSYMRSAQYDEISCSKASTTGGGMYSRAKNESDTSFQLQLGEYVKGKSPEGLWRMKVDGTEIGRWDLSSAAPYDKDGDPVIYIPSIKVNVNDAGIATGFQVKFYFFDKASDSFREVTDIAGLTSTVHSFNMDGGYSQTRSGGDLSVGHGNITFADGIVTGTLDAEDQAAWPCPASGSTQCIEKFGFSYFIGNISYRMSLNKYANP